MAFSMAVLKKALKSKYAKGKISDACLKKFPGYNLINKNNDFSGDYLKVPVKYARGQGRSRTIGDAIANNGTPRYQMWNVDVLPDYFDCKVPREAALRTRDAEQYIKMFADAIDDGIEVVNQNAALAMYGTGGGSRGRLLHTSLITSTYITLADPTMAVNFEEGMVLKADPLITGATVRAGEVTIGQVDRVNGRLYTSDGTNWDAAGNIPALAVDDYLYQDGDQTLGIQGLASWILAAPPTAGVLHCNVDRYIDTRLFGGYFDASGYTMGEGIKRGLAQHAASFLEMPSILLMNPIDWLELEVDMINSSLLKKCDVAGTANYGFEGILIPYGSGSVKAVADPMAPLGTGFAITPEELHMTFMGDSVGAQLIDEDGQMIRDALADTYDIRVGSWSNVYTPKPGAHCRLLLR